MSFGAREHGPELAHDGLLDLARGDGPDRARGVAVLRGADAEVVPVHLPGLALAGEGRSHGAVAVPTANHRRPSMC